MFQLGIEKHKKIMKKLNLKMIAISLASLVVCVNLTSCSGDDDEDLNPQPSNPQPSVVKRLVEFSDYGEDEFTKIVYDSKGRISSMIYSNGAYNYTYSADKIIKKWESSNPDSYFWGETTYTYDLSNGLVVKCLEEDYYSNGNLADFDLATLTYNGNYLVEMLWRSELHFDKTTFEWDKGNIISSEEIEEDGSAISLKYEYDSEHFDYGRIAALFQTNSILFDELDEGLLLQGYFGNLPKNILTIAERTDSPDGYYSMDMFSYEYDADGYPIKIKDEQGRVSTLIWEEVK